MRPPDIYDNLLFAGILLMLIICAGLFIYIGTLDSSVCRERDRMDLGAAQVHETHERDSDAPSRAS